MDRLTKRNQKGIAYMAIADTLSKRDQELEGTKPILEGLYAIFQKLAMYEDKDTPQKPTENFHWGELSDDEKKENPQWYCTSCNWSLEEHENYCCGCGHKIDWD